jgi:hypothetical protein
MARGQMQRQRAGDGRLPYTAFSHDKSQLGHRWVLPQRTRRKQFHRKGRKERKELFSGVWRKKTV